MPTRLGAGGLALVAALVGAGCATTPIKVFNAGVPVAGAEVFANGVYRGRTANTGMLYVAQVPVGTTLTARQKLFERPGYRANHGPENGGMSWTERVFITTVDVSNAGVASTHTVTNPVVEQDLTVNPANTLIGLHFMVSANWDASQAELDDIASKMRSSADYMYNASDGQIVLDQMELLDDGTFWNDAEYQWYADLNVWPNTGDTGGYFGHTWYGGQPVVQMSRRTDQGLGDFQVIDHEFGHLAFGLHDEYRGYNIPASGNFCAQHFQEADPSFGYGMARASCVMNEEWGGTKFCSGHSDDPHRGWLFQGGPCWNDIAATFQDNQSPARWTLKTPTTRSAIVGTISPANPWKPRVTVTNNGSPNLCQAFPIQIVHMSDGQPAVNQNVVLVLAGSGRNVTLGPTDATGTITVVGAHTGDRLEFNGNWTVGTCTTTM